MAVSDQVLAAALSYAMFWFSVWTRARLERGKEEEEEDEGTLRARRIHPPGGNYQLDYLLKRFLLLSIGSNCLSDIFTVLLVR